MTTLPSTATVPVAAAAAPDAAGGSTGEGMTLQLADGTVLDSSAVAVDDGGVQQQLDGGYETPPNEPAESVEQLCK